MKITIKYTLLVACCLFITSCYKDKGNYTYTELEKVEITLPEGVSAMAYAEEISFSPSIVSSIAGEIGADNNKYEFGCKLNYYHKNEETQRYEQWVDINPDKKKDIKFQADFPANNYTIWYYVTNKETGVSFNAKGSVKILSSTSEGWMVLNNVGADNKVRLDIISKNSKGEDIVAYNVLGSKAPELFNGTQIVMNPSMYYGAESIFLFSHSGAYKLSTTDLTTSAAYNIKLSDFIISSIPGEPVSMTIVNAGNSIGPTSRLCVTDAGNAYAIRSSNAGSSFETPLNTNKGGEDPTYQVSHLTGTSMMRKGNSSCVLLYDITNKKFVGWSFNSNDNNVCFPLSDPETNKKFSFNTGMDIVDMVSTKFSDGLVYTILQDASKARYIYGINLSGSKFTQESYYKGITAEHFNDATDYAFHSQFPFMFYSFENKVYSYNLGTGSMNQILSLPAGEEVTMLKFNLFVNPNLAMLADHSEEFLSKQFDLIVASTTGSENGGIVRFYKVDIEGQMSMINEFKGFDKVVDVTYRERR